MTFNRYTASGALPDQVTSTTLGSFTSNDGYENLTTALVDQGRGIIEETKNIVGLSKRTTSLTVSLLNNFDRSTQESKNLSRTNYNQDGVLWAAWERVT
jgi:hypothetical protein